jgi:outer membrane assembly lipoprotein YfiO
MKRLALLAALAASCAPAQAKWTWDPSTGFVDTKSYELGDPKELFDRAMALYEKAHYLEAAEEFAHIAEFTPNPVIQEKAQFMAAEALFFGARFWAANQAYEDYIRYYPETDRLQTVVQRRLEIGFKLMSGAKRETLGIPLFGATGSGVDLVRKLLAEHPYQDFSDEYQMRLANWFYERRDYKEAEAEYDHFIKTYPDSPWVSTARFQLARCQELSAQGIPYDRTPLWKAESSYQAYIEANPSGDRAAEAKAELEAIRDAQAEKDFDTAEFYARRDRAGSAAYYLKRILRRHPGSRWAQRAGKRLAELGVEVPAEEGAAAAEGAAGPAEKKQ